MKKLYFMPEFEATELLFEDILTTSNDDEDLAEDEVVMDGDSLFD